MKKRILSAFAVLLSLLLLFTACNDDNTDPSKTPQGNNKGWATGELPVNVSLYESDLSELDLTFSKGDLNHAYNPLNSTTIEFSPDGTKIVGSGATLSETDNVVHIHSGGNYTVSGYAPKGSIWVEATKVDKVNLLFNGVNLHSTSSPALYVKSAEKVTITLLKDTENKLSDGSDYTLMDGTATVDAAIYSKEDLAINGYGKLTVLGNRKHGIDSKDDLIITGGTISVDALGVALGGKDCVKICNAVLSINAGSDAIRSDNATEAHRGFVYIQSGTITATATNDVIQASNALIIEDGTLNLTSYGSSDPTASAKGLKSDSDIVVKGGTVTVTAAEDAINSKKSILLSGGTLTLSANDDAVNADLDLVVSGATVTVTEAAKGFKAEDVVIRDGVVSINSLGDGIAASGEVTLDTTAGNIAITGGYVYVSSKKDAIDANTSIFITGGVTLVDGESTDKNVTLNANEALTISGGVMIATGSAETVKSVTAASNQGVMAVSFKEQTAGTPIVLYDAAGTAIVSFTPTKNYSAAIVSAPEMQSGNTYTLCAGGTVTDANANGYAHNVSYTKGTDLAAAKLTTNVYNQIKK